MKGQNDKDTMPKVLVGTPVYSGKKYITREWINSVLNLTYKNYDVLVVDNGIKDKEFLDLFKEKGIMVLESYFGKNTIERILIARQKLYDYALQNGYDYLFSVEQDILVPEDILEKLLLSQKDIIGAPYIVSSHTNEKRRRIDFVVSASKFEKVIDKLGEVDVNEWYLASEIKEKGVIKVKSCSLGCTLISTNVLKKIRARADLSLNRADDSYFFQDCLKNEIGVYLDSSLLGKVKHIKDMYDDLQVGGDLDVRN